MFDPTTFTGFHTWLSLIAIAAGIVVVRGLLRGRNLSSWTALFLVTAFGTSATGFGFPFSALLPSHVVGAIALVVLAVAALARWTRHYAGAWRWIYAVSIVTSLYLLVFVGIAQAFAKIPALRASAPTQSEPSFVAAQLAALAIFAAVAVLAARRFRPAVATSRAVPV